MEDITNLVLVSGKTIEEMFPNKGTFQVDVGDYVKLKFTEQGKNEYMWVEVTFSNIDNNKFEGLLSNEPELVKYVKYGSRVRFKKEEVLDKITV